MNCAARMNDRQFKSWSTARNRAAIAAIHDTKCQIILTESRKGATYVVEIQRKEHAATAGAAGEHLRQTKGCGCDCKEVDGRLSVCGAVFCGADGAVGGIGKKRPGRSAEFLVHCAAASGGDSLVFAWLFAPLLL